MNKADLELNRIYSYRELEEWFDEYKKLDPNAEWHEYGKVIIGEEFIVFNISSLTYSFILHSYNSKEGAMFKLIYKE